MLCHVIFSDSINDEALSFNLHWVILISDWRWNRLYMIEEIIESSWVRPCHCCQTSSCLFSTLQHTCGWNMFFFVCSPIASTKKLCFTNGLNWYENERIYVVCDEHKSKQAKKEKKTGTERIKNKLKHLSWIFDDKNCFQASLAMWYYSGMLMCAAQASISAQAALTRILKFKRIQKFFINTIIDEPNWNRLPAELEDILCNYHLCWSLTFSHRFTSFMCDFILTKKFPMC